MCHARFDNGHFIETLASFFNQVMSNHCDVVWIRDGIITPTYFNLPRLSKDFCFLPLLVDMSSSSALDINQCFVLNCTRQNCSKMLPRLNVTKSLPSLYFYILVDTNTLTALYYHIFVDTDNLSCIHISRWYRYTTFLVFLNLSRYRYSTFLVFLYLSRYRYTTFLAFLYRCRSRYNTFLVFIYLGDTDTLPSLYF